MKHTIFSKMIMLNVFIFLLILFQQKVSAEVIVPAGYTVEVYAENVPMPFDLCFDSIGNLYVGHDGETNLQIYKILPGGWNVIPFGPSVRDPDSVTVDSEDNIWVGSGRGALYKVTPDGDSIVITSTLLGNICSLVVDHDGILDEKGTVYVGNARSFYDIVKIRSNEQPVEFVSKSDLYVPFGMAFDDVNSLYVAEYSNGGLYQISSSGNVSLFAELTSPVSVDYNRIQKEIYVADVDDNMIYRISLNGEVTIFAENISPRGLTFGHDGCLYVSDRSISPHRILKISGFPTEPPELSKIIVDLDPDIFEIAIEEDLSILYEFESEFLTAFIEAPSGMSASSIDVNTLSLSMNNITLAVAESPLIVDNILEVLFRLDLVDFSAIVGLEVTGVYRSSNKIKVKATTYPAKSIDLVDLALLGDFTNGDSVIISDVVRIIREDQ